MNEDVSSIEEYEDMAVTGDLIKELPESERYFEIRERPYYEEHEQRDGTKKKKVTIPITLGDGRKAIYYPNRTSERNIARLAKTNKFTEWVGKKFFWGKILDQNVFGEQKKVPYVTGVYPPVEKQ